jgi:hypothetical protein
VPTPVAKPNYEETYVCNPDLPKALDWFAMTSNPANHWATFIVEVKNVRPQEIKCEYCDYVAHWLIRRFAA